jgi:DNA polymerase-4
VGKVTAAELESMGITTIGRLAAVPAAHLEARLGRHAADLQALALGQDDRPVDPFSPAKSIGAEETFGVDHRDVERLRATLRGQAERVAREMRQEGCAGRTVTLKLRFADFSTITRRHTGDATQDGLHVYREAARLLDGVTLRQAVRLIGLSVSGLGPAGQGQLSLLGPDAPRRERLGRALDRLAERFGDDSVRPASLLRGRPRPTGDGAPPAAGRPRSEGRSSARGARKPEQPGDAGGGR